MTELNKGQTIQVTYVAQYVKQVSSVGQHLVVDNNGHTCLVPEYATIEPVAPKLAIDDILTTDSPEPPTGTTIIDDDTGASAHNFAVYNSKEVWYITGRELGYTWGQLIANWGCARVVYVRQVLGGTHNGQSN